ENVYAVPQGYFDAADFSAKARRGKAKVVKMNFARRWVQYAAAAVISGVLVTSAFLYTDNSTSAEYNKYSRIDVPAELNKVSEDDLTSYLDNNEHYAIAAELNAPVNEDITDGNEPVQVLSDEELDQYLKENAEATAAAKKI
ncbi:MAG: hypothetical protein JWQ78_2253, partial [Sediminibacterium sp.]|nr:hypothetical protein [Sediminibacterium sp.]